MSTNSSVTVLLPNGRRQTVKVTPNTTILQVLDEVCQNHGYEADRYDVKHFNKILDANAIFRFTGLSNNAQLEMIPCVKRRELSNITIRIQLENGERLTGEFSPNTVLSEILLSLTPYESTETVILVYMHREISGKEELDKTTLKSLGLTSGGAMLRLLHRDPNQKKEQAHVYIPKKLKNTSKEDNELPSTSFAKYITNKILDPINSIKSELTKQKQENEIRSSQEKKKTLSQVQSDRTERGESKKTAKAKSSPISTVQSNEIQHDEIEIQFLGERNALVFNQAGARAIRREDLPDSFFDLTVEDAKVLLRDSKKHMNAIEDSPLLTVSQRQLESDKKTLNQLRKYQRAIIRIQFPDQLVLQGLFGPLETVLSIQDFVRGYLENPDTEFTLYTTPPKKNLNPNFRLIDEDLVPSSLIYYSGPSLLKSELKQKLTDPLVATKEATKTRRKTTRELQENCNEDPGLNETNVTGEISTPASIPGTSKAGNSDQQKGQAPKWFTGLFK